MFFGFDRLHPMTYLNGERWEDDIISDTADALPQSFKADDFSGELFDGN